MIDHSQDTAIIGNGPSAGAREIGHIIDRFGTVIRINKFNIEPPYDKCVGTKTDIWFAGEHRNSHLNKQGENDTQRDPALYREVIHFSTKEKHEDYLDYEEMVAACSGRTVLTHTPVHIYAALIRKMGLRGLQKPTTGLVCIFYFLRCRNCPYVYVTGFDAMQDGHYWDKEHGMVSRHSPKHERDYLNELKRIGLAKEIEDEDG